MMRIKEDIKHSLSKSDCSLHAYVIMTKSKKQLAIFMQSMANRYVRYFNAIHHRTGTIWEGRFKSCLVDSEHYLFTLYKYIEMNPVKANMVKDIADYKWSSYEHNALGQPDSLITEHPLYKNLGIDKKQRYESYKEMFAVLNTTKQDEQIKGATMRGEVFGSDGFHSRMSELISRSTKLTAHGGDRKSEAYKNQFGLISS